MGDVSHRDSNDGGVGTSSLSGAGSPEGIVSAPVGAVYRRTDGGTSTTLYVKESDEDGEPSTTGWVAHGAANANDAALAVLTAVTLNLNAAIAAATADQISGDASLDARVDDLEAADTALDTRLDAIEANDWATNAKLANVATATFKGRNTAGTGDPEDLTAAQALALLADATATTRGVVPTPPNNTTTFLRGDATFAAPKLKLFLVYGGAVMTAGNTDRYPNPVGFATSPISATSIGYRIPVTGNLIKTHYQVSTAHTTNTVTVTPRLNGVEQTTQAITISAGVTGQATTVTSLPVAAGDYISCQMDHNGATNLANLCVMFEIEY